MTRKKHCAGFSALHQSLLWGLLRVCDQAPYRLSGSALNAAAAVMKNSHAAAFILHTNNVGLLSPAVSCCVSSTG